MRINLLEKKDFNISKWAHGDSIQLYIYPKDSDYSKGKFLWRVSTATIESGRSEFTVFHGVKRWIMPFDSDMLLSHAQNGNQLYSIHIKQFETHCFKGAWSTTAQANGADFNLLLKNGADGMIKHLRINEGEKTCLAKAFKEAFDERFPVTEQMVTIGLYSRNGNFEVLQDLKTHSAKIYELIIIEFELKDFEDVRKIVLKGDADVVMFVVTNDPD